MPPRRARKKPRQLAPGDLGPIDYKRLKLDEVRTDLQMAREDGRITGIAQLHRLEVQLHDEVTAALRSEGETAAEMTTEELMGYILETILDLPLGVQDQISATLQAVRDGSIVKLGKGSRKRRARSAKL